MKIKINELISAYDVLKKIGDINTFSVSIQFKFKTSLLLKEINNCLEMYSKQLQNLLTLYEIKIKDNQFIHDSDSNKLKEFLSKKNELEEIEIEINSEKIIFDKNINSISANDLLKIHLFFDCSELLKEENE